MGYDPANKSINILLRALNSISLLRYAVAMQKRFHFWFSYFRIFNVKHTIPISYCLVVAVRTVFVVVLPSQEENQM